MVASESNNQQPGKVILVTGGTGLVGQAIKWVLANDKDDRFCKGDGEQWIFLSSGDGDLRREEDVVNVFNKYKPTHVIHLAAMVGGLFKNMAQEADFFRDNFMINNNVLHTAHFNKVRKLVACLSTCIFPDDIKLPFDESAVHLGPPHPSNYGYAYAKRMVDVQCRYLLSDCIYIHTYNLIIQTHPNIH